MTSDNVNLYPINATDPVAEPQPESPLTEIPQEILDELLGRDSNSTDDEIVHSNPLNSPSVSIDPLAIPDEPYAQTEPEPQPSTSCQNPETLPVSTYPSPETPHSVPESILLSDKFFKITYKII
ncbi:unnamed protein product, partial [Brenthis ino]